MADEALQGAHRKLRELAGQLSKQLGPQTATNADAIRDLLNRMDRILTAHLAAEETGLYPKLIADRRPNVAERARNFQREMGGIKKAFSDYSDKWSRSVIATQPTIFRRETLSLMAALTGRIEREEQELYPMVVVPAASAR